MPANPNYDALLATTLANYRNTFEDNVFSSRPLINHLTNKGRIRRLDGGQKIVEQLMTGMNTTASSYSGYDTLNISPQDGFSAAEYPWRQYAVSVAINGLEEMQNSGKSQLIDLLEGKIMQAEETASEKLNQMLYGNGLGNGGKDMLGLEAIIGTGAIGGIDPAIAGNEFWRSVVIAAGADAAPLRDDTEWTRAYNTASRGNDAPDFIITTQDLYEHYEEGLVGNIRYTDVKQGDGRFQALVFKNTPLVFDTYCPAGTTYFLNSKYIRLTVASDKWMKPTPFKDAPDKDARYSNLLSYGNLTTSNRARLAKVTGQTVA